MVDINIDYNFDNYEPMIDGQDIRILKAIISDPGVVREFNNSYDHTLFVGASKKFAEMLLGYYRVYGAVPTKRVMLEKADKNIPLSADIDAIWEEINNTEYVPNEFKYDLDKIKNRFSEYKISQVRDSIDGMSFDKINYDEELRRLQSILNEAEKVRRGTEKVYVQKTFKEYLPEFKEGFVKKSKDPTAGQGILTGYTYLDFVTNGLVPSSMLIVAAETGGGKSFLLNNMAIQMWMQNNKINTQPEQFTKGYNIQYFSLEMPFDQCIQRSWSRLSQINTYALRDCNITKEEDLDRLSQAAKFIHTYPYDFEVVDIPRGVTIKQIEDCYLEAVVRGRRPDVVVVDYLGLMHTDSDGEDWLRLGEIAGELHEFGRAYNVVILTAVQLNRAKGKDQNDTIGLHRIGRSGLIMTHATVGIQIETRINEKSFTDMPYHIIKNRNGEEGSHILRKDFARATVVDLKPYEPQYGSSSDLVSGTTYVEDLSQRLIELGWA